MSEDVTTLVVFSKNASPKLLSEIEGIGYPLLRATNAADAKAKAAATRSLLVIDAPAWEQIAHEMFTHVLAETVRVVVVSGIDTVASRDLVAAVIRPNATPTMMYDMLAPHLLLVRRGPRVELAQKGAFVTDGMQIHNGIVCSLGMAGGAIKLNRVLPIGTSGILTFEDPKGEVLEIHATIVNHRPDGRTVGVKFGMGLAGQDDLIRQMMIKARIADGIAPRRRALAFDASTLLLRGMKLALESEGWDVVITDKLAEFAQHLAKGGFDVVIADPASPSLGAGRLADLRRRMGVTPFFALTRSADVQAQVAAAQAFDGLRKGAFADQLSAKLAALLAAQRAAA